MYMPAHFEETRPEVLQALLRAHPLATWVVQSDAGLVVNHIPFLARHHARAARHAGRPRRARQPGVAKASARA